MSSITCVVPDDFSFLETVNSHGWKQLLPFEWVADDSTMRRVYQFSDGAVELIEISMVSGQLVIRTDSPLNSRQNDELVRAVKRIFQLNHDLEPFHSLCRTHSALSQIPNEKKGRLLRSPTLLEDIVKVILTTNTTWTQTMAMNARLIKSYGAPLDGHDLSAFPTPEAVAAVPFEEFAESVRMGYRAQSVHELFCNVANGSLDLEALESSEIGTHELKKRLLALRGVGPYASACLLLYLGRPTQVSVDSWARMLLSRELGRPVTDRDVHDYFDPYGEWRGLVYYFYPWKHQLEAANEWLGLP